MSARWLELEEPWRLAFEQAITAYLERASIPIGAVIVDDRGQAVAYGANAFAVNRLAHAELNALVALPAETDRITCEIYTTLEPCPMCTGAIRQCQLRAVHFAARDPAAGSTALLQANEYMRQFPCAVRPPRHADLEAVVVALIMERRYREGHTRWLEHWRRYHPLASAHGLTLLESGAYARWVAESATAEAVFDEVSALPRMT
jgi:tRNA(adenine34) deaminase